MKVSIKVESELLDRWAKGKNGELTLLTVGEIRDDTNNAAGR